MRAERKKWVKTLQRLECVDAGSYTAMAEALKDVRIIIMRPTLNMCVLSCRIPNLSF